MEAWDRTVMPCSGPHDFISLITSYLPLFGLKQVAVPIIPFSSGFAASLSGHTRWPRRASGPSSAAMQRTAKTKDCARELCHFR